MKAAQSSLYREVENVLIWFIPVSARVPKIIALRSIAEECTTNLSDALTSIALGLQSDSLEDTKDCIDMVLLHITKVKTAVKILKEFSDRSSAIHILNDRQVSNFSLSINKISTELGKWRSKVVEKLNRINPTNIHE